MGLYTAGVMPAHAADKADSASPLPVRDVVLFSSGVGYFQHSGEINGATSLDFSFRTEQINDLLKSLVLFDPAGAVQPVTYTTHDPVSRGLGGLGLDLNSANPMAALLRQIQGAEVKVTTSGGVVEGRILSVNPQPVSTKEGVVNIDILNLLTPNGLTSIPLTDVKSIQLTDPQLDRKFREGLTLLASGLDKQRKSVSVHFGGNGRREVRMGYLLESPVWKTSYRLVLDEKKAPYLQGWAIVENMTDEDWNGVHLSLVSGRPVSFIQDLYTPLYVPRPVVQPQVIGSPTPQISEGALEAGKDALVLRSEAEDAPMSKMMPAPAASMAADATNGGFGGGATFGAMNRSALMARRRDIGDVVNQLAQSVGTQAQGAERGELFEYAIAQPVTIPTRQAAMVPIVGASAGGGKVSVYNPQVNAERPMSAVKLKNTTGLQLAGGPITVFDAGVYGGDGQIDNLQPDEERLITYAVDLSVEAKTESKPSQELLLTVRADSGVFYITRKLRRVLEYTLRNKDDRARTILVEQPIDPSWKLVKPVKADEETASLYRFQVEVPAKTTGKLEVITEQPLSEQFALVDADLNLLMGYAQNTQLSEAMRAALKELVGMRRKITDLQTQRAQAEAEITAITQEQTRIRDNMKELDKQSALYQQYVRKLTEQETHIEEVRAKIKRLLEAENQARAELRKYLDGLKIEA